MRRSLTWQSWSWEWYWAGLLPLAIVIGWTAIAIAERPIRGVYVAALVLYFALLAVSIRRPVIFVAVFLGLVMILPPFYLPSSTGETPFYVSILLLPIAFAIFILRRPERKLKFDSVALALALFLISIGISLPFAFLFSGNAVALQSVFRWFMLAQSLLLFMLVRVHCSAVSFRQITPVFFILAAVSASYGIVDFFSPVPIPHHAADQFMWLGSEVLRRAQGVFYESCNFSNFCGFFLVAASAAMLTAQEKVLRIGRSWLLLIIFILALAVVLAFSRSAWGSVLLSLSVYGVVSRQVKPRRAMAVLLTLGIPLAVLWFVVPQVWSYLATARIGALTQIFTDPNLASSGRLDIWAKVISILQNYPQFLLFGVGYKTLPFTRLFHGQIITDNGYLSLLLETGILGLSGFVIFSGAVFKTFFRLARTGVGPVSFWSFVIFSFWCGECLQMVAADAHTYWRNLIVFTALMAFTLNWAERRHGSLTNTLTLTEKVTT